jgi:hypothetical protein
VSAGALFSFGLQPTAKKGAQRLHMLAVFLAGVAAERRRLARFATNVHHPNFWHGQSKPAAALCCSRLQLTAIIKISGFHAKLSHQARHLTLLLGPKSHSRQRGCAFHISAGHTSSPQYCRGYRHNHRHNPLREAVLVSEPSGHLADHPSPLAIPIQHHHDYYKSNQ